MNNNKRLTRGQKFKLREKKRKRIVITPTQIDAELARRIKICEQVRNQQSGASYNASAAEPIKFSGVIIRRNRRRGRTAS